MNIVEHEQQVEEKLVELDEVGEILASAAERVRSFGWVQNDWGFDKGGPQCVQGHIATAGAGRSRFVDASNRLSRSLGLIEDGGHSNIEWNNTPGRTAEEVAEALERAAYNI